MDSKPHKPVDEGCIWQDKPRLYTVLAYEFIGTAVVTYAFTISYFDMLIRAIAYFIVYIVAAHISGAHFNPAITFACFIYDRSRSGSQQNNKDALKQLGAAILVQLLGSFLGILITFILAKDYVVSLYLLPDLRNTIYHYSDTFTNTDGYQFTRIFAQEALQTFVFALVFLSFRG